MSYLPNTRDEDSGAYYEGNLTKENKARIEEYDFAVEQVTNALDNLECIDTSELDTDQEYHLRKVVEDDETRQALREYFLEFMEIQRNDYVIAMIENQPDDEEENINVKELKEQMELDPTY